jgi:hypothetical protein
VVVKVNDEQVFWLTIIGGFVTNIFASILVKYILESQTSKMVFIDQYGNRLEAKPIMGYGSSLLSMNKMLVELRKNGKPAGKVLVERR